jgi:hypothetical protein
MLEVLLNVAQIDIVGSQQLHSMSGRMPERPGAVQLVLELPVARPQLFYANVQHVLNLLAFTLKILSLTSTTDWSRRGCALIDGHRKSDYPQRN